MIKSICIFTGGYPTNDNPEFAFIRPLACAMADYGIDVSVICTQSITHAITSKKKLRPERWEDVTEKGNRVKIYQPRTITFSKRGAAFNRITNQISVKGCIAKYKITPEVVYAHFWHDGVLAYKSFPDKPLFIATGESKIWVDKVWDRKSINRAIKHINGVISVSSKNLVESLKLQLLRYGPATIIVPNAVDLRTFFKSSREEARRRLGFEIDPLIGVFVGEFGERKGSERVLAAAKGIPELKLIMIGKGVLSDYSQVVFNGVVAHESVVDYLNAADFFVLPTLAEGCCNAIIEAIACGLPIISSDRSFNDDILECSYSIRIDPQNIEQLSSAMKKMKNEDLRYRMSQAALDKSIDFTIEKRTKKILDFISENVGND